MSFVFFEHRACDCDELCFSFHVTFVLYLDLKRAACCVALSRPREAATCIKGGAP